MEPVQEETYFTRVWNRMVHKVKIYGLNPKSLIRMLDECKNTDHYYVMPNHFEFYSRVQKTMELWKPHCAFKELKTINISDSDGASYTEEYDRPAYLLAVVKVTITRSWLDSIKETRNVPKFVIDMCIIAVPCLLPIRKMGDGVICNYLTIRDRKDKEECTKRRSWFSRHLCALRFLCKEVMDELAKIDGIKHQCVGHTRCSCEELFHLTYYFILNNSVYKLDGRTIQRLMTYADKNAFILDKAEILMFAFMSLMPNQQRFNSISIFFGDKRYTENTKRYHSINHYKERLLYYVSTIGTDHVLPVLTSYETKKVSVIFNFRLDIRQWEYTRFKVLSVSEAYDALMDSDLFLPECLMIRNFFDVMTHDQKKDWMCLFFDSNTSPYSFRVAVDNTFRFCQTNAFTNNYFIIEGPFKTFFVFIQYSFFMAINTVNLSFVSEKRCRFINPVGYSPIFLRNWYRTPLICREKESDVFCSESHLQNIAKYGVLKSLFHWIASPSRKGGETKLYSHDFKYFYVYDLLPAIVNMWTKPMLVKEFRDQYQREIMQSCEKKDISVINKINNYNQNYCRPSDTLDTQQQQHQHQDITDEVPKRIFTIPKAPKVGRGEDADNFTVNGKQRKRSAHQLFTDANFSPLNLFEIIITFFDFNEVHMIHMDTFREIKDLITDHKYSFPGQNFLPTDFDARMRTEFNELRIFFIYKSFVISRQERGESYICSRFVPIKFDTNDPSDPQNDAWPGMEYESERTVRLLEMMYKFLTCDMLPADIRLKWIRTIVLSKYQKNRIKIGLVNNFKPDEKSGIDEDKADALSKYCYNYFYDQVLSCKIDRNGECIVNTDTVLNANDTANTIIVDPIHSLDQSDTVDCSAQSRSRKRKNADTKEKNVFERTWMDFTKPCNEQLTNTFKTVYYRNTSYAKEIFDDSKIREATNFHSFLSMLEWCCFFYQKEIWPKDKRAKIRSYKRQKMNTSTMSFISKINVAANRKSRKPRKTNKKKEKTNEIIRNGGFDGYLKIDVERVLNENEMCGMCIKHDKQGKIFDFEGMFLFKKTTSKREFFCNQKPDKPLFDLYKGRPIPLNKYKTSIDPSENWYYTDNKEITAEESEASFFPLINILSLYYGYTMDRVMDSVTVGTCVLQLKPFYNPGWKPYPLSMYQCDYSQ